MLKGILLSAYVTKIATLKDKSVNVTLMTQELSPSKAGDIFNLLNALATVYITNVEISARELDQVDNIQPDLPGKTKSQRLRNHLFRLWELQSEGHKEFDTYYAMKMESLINGIKNELDKLTI